ncbi:alpha/beta fold hydrolase [Paenibacillus sp. BK720]|uniref:alpha/beta fold hydrolase n=1 Tax=Paenibacillus sp. BK720 TaxID=2587092 RepID=UPI001423567F|nr:alpha/beta fold hydrolase [Paenibacillus sp. BK720]NIK71920.1 pimeloyl-[acyl-carrier protein] methyl ester esterase [Paenibacillus sp. BK720]
MTVFYNNGTILWLTGWSIADSVFDSLREALPEYHHMTVNYCEADTQEKMIFLTETAAKKIKRPLLIGGWSLGGMLALRLAAMGLTDGLLLFAATAQFTRPRGESDRGWADAYVRRMSAGLVKEREAVETRFRRMLFTEMERETKLDQLLPPHGIWSDRALIAGLQVLREEEVLSRLNLIRCPVYLVHGTEDEICPYGAALELASLLPQARLDSIPSSGHVPFLGREEEIAKRFRSWWHEQSNDGNSTSI